MRNALITGVRGQDGSFLVEFLLKKKYQVFGLSQKKHSNNELSSPNISILQGDITSKKDIIRVLLESKPDEIYHLASESQPGKSWQNPTQFLNTNGIGTVLLLQAIQEICPNAKVCNASSSEIFGGTDSFLQNELTPINPINPYAASKAYAHHMACIYRQSHRLFVSNAILFNHESEQRPLHFLTQKVSYGAACAALGISNSLDKDERGKPIVCNGKLVLGNLNAAKDWGYAPDFVEAMWLMLQQNKSGDFVIGTGKLHSVAELCEIAYSFIGKDWKKHTISEPSLIRPQESAPLTADYTKAASVLNWEPTTSFQNMIEKMVHAQIKRIETLTHSTYTT